MIRSAVSCIAMSKVNLSAARDVIGELDLFC